MPAIGIYPKDDTVTASPRDDGQAVPKLTVAISPEYMRIAREEDAEESGLMSPGVIGAIAVVSVLVIICVATAAILHQWWCMSPRCKVCRILGCGRRKPQTGQVWDKRLSNLPTFTTTSFDIIPSTSEKSGCSIFDRSPPDRPPRPDNEGHSTFVTKPRLQEICDNKPQYFDTNSIISNVVLITTTHDGPGATASPIASTPPEPAAKPDREREPVERSTERESYPPSALGPTSLSRIRSRVSQASGLLSIITLPSFISNDRPRTYSSSAGGRGDSPVRPHGHHRRRSSASGQRFSRSDSLPPTSPVNDEGTSGKKSRPTSGALQIITSVLKRRGSTSPSVRSSSPSSRRSSRRSLGRQNFSPGAEDEAAIEWRRLPPLHAARSNWSTPTPRSRATSGFGEFLAERPSSHRAKEPQSPDFLAIHIPLPASPLTLASSVSPMAYAPPSPKEATPYASYPPLLPSTLPTPRPYSCPPAPHSTGRFMDTHTVRAAGRTVSLAIDTLRRLFGEVDRIHPNLSTPTAAIPPASPGGNSGFLSGGLSDDGAGQVIDHISEASVYSQDSNVREFVFPPPPLPTVPFSLPPPMSPRGPRPLPTSGQLSKSETHSQTSSTVQ